MNIKQLNSKLDNIATFEDDWHKDWQHDNYRKFTKDEIQFVRDLLDLIFTTIEQYLSLIVNCDIKPSSGSTITIYLKSTTNKELYLHCPNDYCEYLMYTIDSQHLSDINEGIVINVSTLQQLLSWLLRNEPQATQYPTFN